jgi:osmotically inducible protein OsmC
MATRNATAVWNGELKNGNGEMRLGGGEIKGKYTYSSRFEEGPGTNPEELIGAALSGCFSMQLALELANAGHEPRRIETNARVRFEKGKEGFSITAIQLNTRGDVRGIKKHDFQEIANKAKENCPVSRALQGVRIGVEAILE